MKHFPTCLLLIVLTVCGVAQNSKRPLQLPPEAQPIEASLRQLDDALFRLGGRPPADSISKSLGWLKRRLKKNEPEEYRLSLTHDAFLLGLAAQAPNNLKGLIANVADDLKLKANDCRDFGHGRMVPIRVRTLRSDGKTDSGWRIRYVWIPSTKVAITPATRYFPAISSPADYQLPPGTYEMFAERIVNGQLKSVDGGPVPVGGMERIDWNMVVN